MPAGTSSFVPVWRIAPFIRLVVPLMAGIILARWIPWTGQQCLYLILACIVAASYGYFYARRYPIWFGISLFGLWVGIGINLYTLLRIENTEDFIGRKYLPGSIVSATLTTPLEEKENAYRAEAKLHQWDSAAASWISLSGNIIIYFSKTIQTDSVGFGSKIAFKRILDPIRSEGNPGGFNYKKFAADRGLFYSVFIEPADFLLPDSGYTTPILPWHIRARDFLLQNIRKYIPYDKCAGVAAALLCGYRGDMDKALVQQYAATGVAHIIAISGLHLGLIMQALTLIFNRIKPIRNRTRLTSAVIIILLWAFTLITGASPSVLRSALMFSVLLLGKVIGREGNSWNSLAASGFILLVGNPNLLFDVGFQLSYSAMLSIFMFSRPIAIWFEPESRVGQYVWTLISATIAAQVLTLPFVVYYFHQFPVYFILSNLIAVFLSTIALYVTVVLAVLVWFIPPVAIITGILVSYIIKIMNKSVAIIYSLPFSRIEHLYLSLSEAVWLMAIIFLLSAWLLLKSRACAVWALAFTVLFMVQREYSWYLHGRQKRLVVYNINRYTALDVIDGHTATFYGDTACLDSAWIFNNKIEPSRMYYKVNQTKTIPVDTTAFRIIKMSGVRMLVLDKEPDLMNAGKITVDWLFIATNLRTRPERILDKISCQAIIVGTKLPPYKVQQWHSAIHGLPLRLHSVREDGAFLVDFNRGP